MMFTYLVVIVYFNVRIILRYGFSQLSIIRQNNHIAFIDYIELGTGALYFLVKYKEKKRKELDMTRKNDEYNNMEFEEDVREKKDIFKIEIERWPYFERNVGVPPPYKDRSRIFVNTVTNNEINI